MKMVLRHPSGATKQVKLGFSWTTFFFGLFVPLIRGDLKWAAIMFSLELLVGIFTFGIGAWVVGIIFAFVYNKIHARELGEKGYEAINDADATLYTRYING